MVFKYTNEKWTLRIWFLYLFEHLKVNQIQIRNVELATKIKCFIFLYTLSLINGKTALIDVIFLISFSF